MALSHDNDTIARLRERDRPDLRSKVFAPTHRAIYHLGGDMRLRVVIDEEFPGVPEGAAAVRESGGATYFAERSRLSDVEVIW